MFSSIDCLLSQLKECAIFWNVVNAVGDASFDSSSSLTKGLWGVFKQKISNPLAHLLLVSDVWRISDRFSMNLWCDFVDENYPNRLILPSPSDSVVQMPIGFRLCTRPLGRLLASFKNNQTQNINEPLQWLLNRLAENEDNDSQEIKQVRTKLCSLRSTGVGANQLRLFYFFKAYFLDCFLLRIHPHLHSCLRKVPLSKMGSLVDYLFEEPVPFFTTWEEWEARVIAVLELVSLVSFAKSDDDFWDDATLISDWKSFTKEGARLSLKKLGSPDVTRINFIMAVSSIEVCSYSLIWFSQLFKHFVNILDEFRLVGFAGQRGRFGSAYADFENHQTNIAVRS